MFIPLVTLIMIDTFLLIVCNQKIVCNLVFPQYSFRFDCWIPSGTGKPEMEGVTCFCSSWSGKLWALFWGNRKTSPTSQAFRLHSAHSQPSSSHMEHFTLECTPTARLLRPGGTGRPFFWPCAAGFMQTSIVPWKELKIHSFHLNFYLWCQSSV